MTLRSLNELVDIPTLLTNLGTVLIPNTQMQASGGQIYLNDWSTIEKGQAIYPCGVLEIGQSVTNRLAWRTWAMSLTVRLVYYDEWAQQPNTFGAIWTNIDADLHRMKANLEDNPTVTVGGTPHALRVTHIEMPTYSNHKDDRVPVSVIRRDMILTLRLPPYPSAI